MRLFLRGVTIINQESEEADFPLCSHRAPCTKCNSTGKIPSGKTYLDYVPKNHYLIVSNEIIFSPNVLAILYRVAFLIGSKNIYWLKRLNDKGNIFQIEEIEIILMPMIFREYSDETIDDYNVINLSTKHQQLKVSI